MSRILIKDGIVSIEYMNMTSAKKQKSPKKRIPKTTKKPLWKRQDEKKRDKKRTTQSKLIILGIFLLLISVVGLFVYRVFSSGTWKGRQRYNLLVGKPDDLHALVSISADEPDVLVFVFHPDFIVEAAHGYGDYKIGSLLKLGKLEKMGDALIKRAVQNTVGLKIHGYVDHKVPEDLDLDSKSWLSSVVYPMAMSVIGNEIGVVDVLHYGQSVSGLREDQVEVLPLHESRLAFTIIQQDESELYQFDKLRLDGYLLDRIKGLVYTEEDHGVSIVNTTPHSGMATAISRIMLNSGLDVVGVGENQMGLETTQLLVSSDEIKTSETARFAKSILSSYELVVGDTNEYRADVVILIGEDFYQEMSQKPSK